LTDIIISSVGAQKTFKKVLIGHGIFLRAQKQLLSLCTQLLTHQILNIQFMKFFKNL